MTAPALLPPPDAALDAAGRLRAGAYAGEVEGVERIAGAPLPGLLDVAPVRRLRYKRWVYVGVYGPRLHLGAAIADVGYLGQVFAYVAERGSAAKVEAGWLAPLAVGCRVSGGLAGLHAEARSDLLGLGGAGRRLAVRAEGVGTRVTIAFPGAIRADLRIERAPATPITVLSDMGGGLPGATIKAAGLPVSGEIELEGRRIALDPGECAAVLDWTGSFFPYRTVWHWAAAAGRDRAGRPFGLNVARGVHESPGHTENAVWLDGRPAALPRVRFEPGRAPLDPWRIVAAAEGDGAWGAVDLEFRPLGERAEDVNLGAVASRFRQPYGTYHGRLRDGEGRTCEVDGVPGVAEDHDARW